MDKLAKCGIPLRKAIAMGKGDKSKGSKPMPMSKKSGKGGY